MNNNVVVISTKTKELARRVFALKKLFFEKADIEAKRKYGQGIANNDFWLEAQYGDYEAALTVFLNYGFGYDVAFLICKAAINSNCTELVEEGRTTIESLLFHETEALPDGFESIADCFDCAEVICESDGDAKAMFEIGQRYSWCDWFTGGHIEYTVVERNDRTVTFALVDSEIDGIHQRNETYEIVTDEQDDERVLICEYHDEKGYLYAYNA